MAHSNEERDDRLEPINSDETPDQGFNTIRNSSIETRQKKANRRTYTFLGIIVLTALLIVVLLVTAIAGIITNVANNPDGPDTPALDKDVKWTEITVSDADAKFGPLVLVNATHKYTFPATNDHLNKIPDVWAAHPSPRPYQQSGLSNYMEKTALDALDQMLTDFAAATGNRDVQILYAYRTLKDQEGKEILPGYSDHHTGYGCGLNYRRDGNNYDLSVDPIYTWLSDNAAKYGFIIRYPEAKAEITDVSDYVEYYRYVGVAHATYMTEKDLCMEEYMEVIKGYTQKKPLKITGVDGDKYEVYYVKVSGNTTVKVPENFIYTVSGTNDGGVVVTINRSEAPVESDTTASETNAGTAATPAA